MIDTVIALGCIVALVAAPLAWRIRYDRRTARAMLIRADVEAAVRRALGGESLVSIGVAPATAWAGGRIVLSAPRGYGWLIERSLKAATAAMPTNYDLVIRGLVRADADPEVAAPLTVAA